MPKKEQVNGNSSVSTRRAKQRSRRCPQRGVDLADSRGASKARLGGILTPVGVGTVLEKGKKR